MKRSLGLLLVLAGSLGCRGGSAGEAPANGQPPPPPPDSAADRSAAESSAQRAAGPPAPPLEQRLAEADRRSLRAQAEEDLTAARRAIRVLDPSALDEVQRERFDVLLDLLERAAAALSAGRLPEAGQLAEKARVLAEDLAPEG